MSDTERVPGRPCWIDLATSDMAASRAFYGAVFGWTFEEQPEEFGGYNMILSDGGAVAGAMAKQDPSIPDAWSVYLAVDDVTSAAGAITDAGGQVVVAPMEVGPRGSMVYAIDPAGAAVGGWQAADFDGFGARSRENAPTWFETLSRDYEASVAFYQKAFGWQTSVMSDTPELRYTTLGEGRDAQAGIMDAADFLPEGVPSVWLVYVQVADTDRTVQAVTANGGSILRPAGDTPYGRVAQVADPNGALLCLMQPPDPA